MHQTQLYYTYNPFRKVVQLLQLDTAHTKEIKTVLLARQQLEKIQQIQ